jgi:hypothetical protein
MAVEIERKFLVKELPENLESYPQQHISQGYLCTDPVVRIRRSNDDYYLTYKGKGMMVKEFEDAAAAIGTKGKIVGPVKTQFGYHLIRLDEAIPATTETFAKAKAGIEAFLNGQAQQKAIQDYMAALLKANKVTFKVDMPKAM